MAYKSVNIGVRVCGKDNQPDRLLLPLKSPHMDQSPTLSIALDLTSEMCLAFSGREAFLKKKNITWMPVPYSLPTSARTQRFRHQDLLGYQTVIKPLNKPRTRVQCLLPPTI